MKKRVLSLLAACAMITASFVGLVQTAYAEGHAVRIVVSDGATDTEKTLKFYYECVGADGLVSFKGDLSISEGGTINTFALSAVNPAYKGSSGLGNLWFSDDNGAPSADGEFATATVTVPTDKDTIVTLSLVEFYDSDDWENYASEIGTVTATIPANSGSSGGGETTVTVTPTIAEGNAKAYVDAKDDSKKAVVGKVDLEIDGGSYVFDRSKIKYTATGATEGVTPTAVTDLNDNPLDDEAVSSTIISATNVIVYVVINGTTDIAELSNVTFE